jgi:hypothetical protein
LTAEGCAIDRLNFIVERATGDDKEQRWFASRQTDKWMSSHALVYAAVTTLL